MSFDREGALAAGWTDEQIDAYLATKKGQTYEPAAAEPAPAAAPGAAPAVSSTPVAPETQMPTEKMATAPMIPMPDYRTGQMIDRFTPLNEAGGPIPGNEKWMDRSAESSALVNTGLAGAAMNLVGPALYTTAGLTIGGLAGKYGPKVLDRLRSPPAAPTAAAPAMTAEQLAQRQAATQMNAQTAAAREARLASQAGARLAPGTILGPGGQPLPPSAPAAAPTMAPAPTAAAQPGMLSRMVSAAAPYARAAARVAGPAAVIYEGLQPGTLNTGEQAQLNRMYPERAGEAERNRQAIAQAGRQPRSAADLDQMIRAAAAKKALIGQ